MSIKYSVIIPHKNIPDLLVRCLDSIPQRNDLEIIIVDDNSDPDKVNFNSFPGVKEPNVKIVLTKEGKRAGYARNIGIEHARGEWILFADADDFFLTDNLNKLLGCEIPDDCELVSWRFVEIDLNGNRKRNNSQKLFDDGLFLVRCEDMMYQYRFCMTWVRMVKAEMIKRSNIRFEEIEVSNDTMFATMLSVYLDHYYFYNADCYCYVKRSNSLMTTNSVENIKTRCEVAIRVNEFMIKNGKKVSFNGGYGNWLAQLDYPSFFSVFCSDIRKNGFRNAYRRYSVCCRNYSKISKIPYLTYLKRKVKNVFK